jgi:hypothetical protein
MRQHFHKSGLGHLFFSFARDPLEQLFSTSDSPNFTIFANAILFSDAPIVFGSTPDRFLGVITSPPHLPSVLARRCPDTGPPRAV